MAGGGSRMRSETGRTRSFEEGGRGKGELPVGINKAWQGMAGHRHSAVWRWGCRVAETWRGIYIDDAGQFSESETVIVIR